MNIYTCVSSWASHFIYLRSSLRTWLHNKGVMCNKNAISKQNIGIFVLTYYLMHLYWTFCMVEIWKVDVWDFWVSENEIKCPTQDILYVHHKWPNVLVCSCKHSYITLGLALKFHNWAGSGLICKSAGLKLSIWTKSVNTECVQVESILSNSGEKSSVLMSKKAECSIVALCRVFRFSFSKLNLQFEM